MSTYTLISKQAVSVHDGPMQGPEAPRRCTRRLADHIQKGAASLQPCFSLTCLSSVLTAWQVSWAEDRRLLSAEYTWLFNVVIHLCALLPQF